MIKQITHFMFALACISLLFASCKEDEEPTPPKNEFTVGEYNVELTQSTLEEYGENTDGSYDWDVTLATSGLNFSEETGTGSAIYLDLNSDSATGLSEGSYTWAEERSAFTIVAGAVVVNFDSETEESDYIQDLKAGTVDISFDGGETIVEFNMTGEDNMVVSGYYKGVISQ